MRSERKKEISKGLKKCPFCGGRARIDYSRAFVNSESTKVTLVYCSRCHARSGKFDIRDYNNLESALEDAVKAWNLREDIKGA